MTSRERMLAAIEFTGPDRCPIHHYVFPGAIWRHGRALLDLAERYPDDFGNGAIKGNTRPPLDEDEDIEDVIEWQDGWGTAWRRLRGYTSGEVLRPAIPDWDAWRTYEFPARPADSRYEDFAAQVKERHPEEFVMVGGGGFFQLMQSMRGPDNFYMDLAEDNEGVHELADRMVEHNLYSIERHVKAGADCISFGDDWGRLGIPGPAADPPGRVAAVLQAAVREDVRGPARCRRPRVVPLRRLDAGHPRGPH